MNDKIQRALERSFTKHRIVFWFDADRELRKDFESLEIDDVEKIEVNANEFALKHRMLREQPEQKFLVYREGPSLPDLQNWLLDVQLSHGRVSHGSSCTLSC